MGHPGIDVIRELLGEGRNQVVDALTRRRNLAELAGSPPAPPGVTLTELDLAGRRAERLVPDGAADETATLYLHGGGYCSGSPDTHRAMASAIALASGHTVVTLDYRLAPEDPFPAGLHDAVEAARTLWVDRFAIAGDSAGGGLALATASQLRDGGGPVPVAISLISPWVDLTQTAGTMETCAAVDPMLSAASLTAMAADYLAGTDPRDPLASPLFADLTGLPPMRIDVGSDEVLLDDAHTLAGHADRAGVDVVLQVWTDMIHVFPAFPPELVPEAGECIADIGAFLAHHLTS